MIDDLGGITSQIARLALDAASIRHELSAHNVANAETPGFVPKRLEFAEQLRALVDDVLSGMDVSEIEARVGEFERQLGDTSLVRTRAGDSVEVDQEIVSITENVLYYRALLEGLEKRGEILRMAIRERGF